MFCLEKTSVPALFCTASFHYVRKHLKAPQRGWELGDDSIAAPTADKQIILNDIFVRCMNSDHLCSRGGGALGPVIDGIPFPAMSIAAEH